MRSSKAGFAYARDSSTDGDKLLAVTGTAPPNGLRAVLIKLDSGHAWVLPHRFAAIAGDGTGVLGEEGGNVIEERVDGSVRVLARDATSPTWTR